MFPTDGTMITVGQFIDKFNSCKTIEEMKSFIEQAEIYYAQWNKDAANVVRCNIGFALGEICLMPDKDPIRKLWLSVIDPKHVFPLNIF